MHKRGLWHRAIAVAIINDKKQILMQQRSYKKDKNAGMWDISVAGHVVAGEDSIYTVLREINEEVDINVETNLNIEEFRYMFSFRKEQIIREYFIERQFYDFFVFRRNDLNIEKIKVQESEVEQVKFVDINELNKMIENKEIVERDCIYKELINYLEYLK